MTRSHRRTRHAPIVALLGVVAVLAMIILPSCGASGSAADGRPTVIVTTTILGDLVERVAGDQVRVEVLMPAGTDPHEFEASASQAARMREADLIVANGLGLEERLDATIDAAEGDGTPVIRVGDQLDPIDIPGTDHPDPHIWLDPLRWGRAAAIVADGIATATGVDRTDLDANAAGFSDGASEAWRDAVEIIATIPTGDRLLVTNHDALGYFADRFGLEVIGTVIPGGSTLAEPSAQDVSDLVDALRDSGVRAVFTESTTSPRLITTVARELGSEILVIELPTDSLGPAGSDTATYPDLIRTIAQRIAEGLSS